MTIRWNYTYGCLHDDLTQTFKTRDGRQITPKDLKVRRPAPVQKPEARQMLLWKEEEACKR